MAWCQHYHLYSCHRVLVSSSWHRAGQNTWRMMISGGAGGSPCRPGRSCWRSSPSWCSSGSSSPEWPAAPCGGPGTSPARTLTRKLSDVNLKQVLITSVSSSDHSYLQFTFHQVILRSSWAEVILRSSCGHPGSSLIILWSIMMI